MLKTTTHDVALGRSRRDQIKGQVVADLSHVENGVGQKVVGYRANTDVQKYLYYMGGLAYVYHLSHSSAFPNNSKETETSARTDLYATFLMTNPRATSSTANADFYLMTHLTITKN